MEENLFIAGWISAGYVHVGSGSRKTLYRLWRIPDNETFSVMIRADANAFTVINTLKSIKVEPVR